ncbi:MAG: aldose 1-epimerase [Actinomycetota bacterium]
MTVVLSAGDDRATIDENVGGKLVSLVAGGVERIAQADAGMDPIRDVLQFGSFLMIPWAGRLDAGRLPWEGELYELPKNFFGHAIHGVGFDKPWTVDETTEVSAVLSLDLGAAGWPFGGTGRHRLTLDAGRLELTAEVTAADRSMPVAAGWHPYFDRPDEGDLKIRVDADYVLAVRDDLIPTGDLVPVAGDTDLREGPVLGDRRLDHVFANVRSPAVVSWPDLELTQNFARDIATVVVYTPEGKACCEPQSAWPNAPELDANGIETTGLAHLGPGATWSLTTTWTWQTL